MVKPSFKGMQKMIRTIPAGAEWSPFKKSAGKDQNTIRLEDIKSVETKQIISCPFLRYMVRVCPPGRSVIFPLQGAEVVIEAALLINPFPLSLFSGFPAPLEEGKNVGRIRDFGYGDP
jgi:hypothetical protein